MLDKGYIVLNYPKNCAECNFLNDDYDYPTCIVTGETRGYTFQTHKSKMDGCLFKKFPKELDITDFNDEYSTGWEFGWNNCLRTIKGEQKNYE